MIQRCYLEITNVCNLNCIFCPQTHREKKRLSPQEFEILTDKLQGQIRFLYFHLMGEPLMHPNLTTFIGRAREKGFIPILTTNGTLFRNSKSLVDAPLHKTQISLHSYEGNGKKHPEIFIHDVMEYAIEAARRGTIVVLRLWNQGGHESQNEQLLQLLSQHIPQPWIDRYDGYKLQEKIYLEYDHIFDWPDEKNAEHPCEEVFCYALRNQIGVLTDGTVVPCCLDHEGDIPLGNLFDQSLSDILSSPRAVALYDGFSNHTTSESLCRKCGYANITKRFRKK